MKDICFFLDSGCCSGIKPPVSDLDETKSEPKVEIGKSLREKGIF